jgi:hypothetical protein
MESTQQSNREAHQDIVQPQEQIARLPTRFLLILAAYLGLIRFDLLLARNDFELLYNKVRTYPTSKRAALPGSVEAICSAIDMACIWYRKEVLCLQRSAATVCLLRKYGVPANLVIGAQQMPFKAHAWVEVEGRVVNEKPSIPETYGVLTQC